MEEVDPRGGGLRSTGSCDWAAPCGQTAGCVFFTEIKKKDFHCVNTQLFFNSFFFIMFTFTGRRGVFNLSSSGLCLPRYFRSSRCGCPPSQPQCYTIHWSAERCVNGWQHFTLKQHSIPFKTAKMHEYLLATTKSCINPLNKLSVISRELKFCRDILAATIKCQKVLKNVTQFPKAYKLLVFSNCKNTQFNYNYSLNIILISYIYA